MAAVAHFRLQFQSLIEISDPSPLFPYFVTLNYPKGPTLDLNISKICALPNRRVLGRQEKW